MLSSAEKRLFDTFGFLILRQHLTADQVQVMRRESDRILSANRQGRPISKTRRQSVIPFFEHSEELMALMADDRIYLLGEELVGPDFILNATEGNLHVGETQWHGGGTEVELLPHIKIAFYLEPTTSDSGALRIIPGSHRPEFAAQHPTRKDQHDDPTVMPFGVPGSELPCVVCESQPGDVVIFREQTWHAAFGGKPGRSQHAISFQTNPRNDEELAVLRDLCQRYSFSMHPSPQMIASPHPRLRRMVSRLVELGVGPPAVMPEFEG
jgi:hypothetical protein